MNREIVNFVNLQNYALSHTHWDSDKKEKLLGLPTQVVMTRLDNVNDFSDKPSNKNVKPNYINKGTPHQCYVSVGKSYKDIPWNVYDVNIYWKIMINKECVNAYMVSNQDGKIIYTFTSPNPNYNNTYNYNWDIVHNDDNDNIVIKQGDKYLSKNNKTAHGYASLIDDIAYYDVLLKPLDIVDIIEFPTIKNRKLYTLNYYWAMEKMDS
jgi:hypothetical protein